MIKRKIQFYILFFVTILLLDISNAGANDRFLDIQTVTSDKGITAWFVKDTQNPVLSIKFAFRGGSAMDPEGKSGVAQITASMLDEGAGDMDSAAFRAALENNAISLSFVAGRDALFGSLKTLTENQDLAADLLHLSLTKPRFDSKDLDRMKQANIARIQNSQSDPSWINARLRYNYAFAGHNYARNSGGRITTIRSITPGDLRQFMEERVTIENLVVAVTGDIEAQNLGPLLDKIFGDLPANAVPYTLPRTDIKNVGETYLYQKDIPQTYISLTQNGIARKAPDWWPARILEFTLGGSGFGSLLMEEIREKNGLTYGIYSDFENFDFANGLTITLSTGNDSVPKVLGMIKTIWLETAQNGITDQELKTAKDYLTGSMPLSLSSTDAIAGIVLDLQMNELPIDYLDHMKTDIAAVTQDDIKRAATKIMGQYNPLIILVGAPDQNAVKIDTIVGTLPGVE